MHQPFASFGSLPNQPDACVPLLSVWARALDMRNHRPDSHTLRVTQLTLEVAQRLGVPDENLPAIQYGALLHDIGTLSVPERILLKTISLTPDEWALIRQHPVRAYEWLAPIPSLRQALDIPYSHHERWDGSGYPRRLRGEAIPLAARIFAVVDVWAALSADRPYRSMWAPEQVTEHLRSLAGLHFDPAVVAIFLQLQRESQ